MSARPRRQTHCRVPGHGHDWCEVSTEQDPYYPRSVEERIALDFELAAADTQEEDSQ